MWKKYQEYMNHNINFKCSDVTLQILETGLTEKQLLLMDKRETIINVALMYFLIIGIILGFGLTFVFFKIGVFL